MMDANDFAYAANTEVIQWTLQWIVVCLLGFLVWYCKGFIRATTEAIKELRKEIAGCREAHRRDLQACQAHHVHNDLCRAHREKGKG